MIPMIICVLYSDIELWKYGILPEYNPATVIKPPMIANINPR